MTAASVIAHLDSVSRFDGHVRAYAAAAALRAEAERERFRASLARRDAAELSAWLSPDVMPWQARSASVVLFGGALPTVVLG